MPRQRSSRTPPTTRSTEPRLEAARSPSERLRLPPAFEAFYTLHHDIYLTYARAHLPAEAAERAVREAFAVLAAHWPYIVSRFSPAAYAWDQLVACTRSRTRPLVAVPSQAQYDVVVLGRILGYPEETIAAVLGYELCTVRYLLRIGPRTPRQSANAP
ncbi:hypothetical protein [Streptomyces huasconensis]|uniref:hypothetical protein n=1 Tax=Streptomyces huasconensis TaxID=1854574 RepID=UPI0033FCC950